VLKVDLTGHTASLFANTQANGGNPISTPRGIAFEGGNLFVDDSANCAGACNSGGQEIKLPNTTAPPERTSPGSQAVCHLPKVCSSTKSILCQRLTRHRPENASVNAGTAD
jgi:hypothetical protein